MAGDLKCYLCGQALAPAARFCDRCGAPAGQAPGEVDHQPLRVGEVVEGKWRLEGKLGAGGMGAVFLARDLALDRKVAIKVLAAQLCSDAEFVTRFEREARTTAKLEHANIVPVHAVGRYRGRPFIVMKALEGMTLSKLVKTRLAEGRRLSREEVLALFKQLCAGLGFIHSKGYVHRDVKSGNIFVANDGHVTVLDFGVLRDATAERITRSGVLLGTPHYLAPEQALGSTDLDGRADLYAVGVLLFECITLRPPFTGDAITLLRLHAEVAPPDLTAIVPEVPIAVAAVVRKALAKKPADRFATAAALWEALELAWSEPKAARAGAPEVVAAARGMAVDLDRTDPAGPQDLPPRSERPTREVVAAHAPPARLVPQQPADANATLVETNADDASWSAPTDPARPLVVPVELRTTATWTAPPEPLAPATPRAATPRPPSSVAPRAATPRPSPAPAAPRVPTPRPSPVAGLPLASHDPEKDWAPMETAVFQRKVRPRWPYFVAGFGAVAIGSLIAWLATR